MAKMIVVEGGYQIVDDEGNALSEAGLPKHIAALKLCEANAVVVEAPVVEVIPVEEQAPAQEEAQ